MKPSKIKKVGRRLYIYFKIPFYSSFKKMYYKLQKYYDEDSSLETFIDKTGKYIVIGYLLRSKDEFEELFNEMINWKEESQKQKEAIDKAIECIKKEDEPLYINQWDTLYDGTFIDNYVESNLAQEVLDILKEVSE